VRGAIDAAFARARGEHRAALIAYLMAGDPSLSATAALAGAAADGGADIIELGFAYSDPLADGPIIAASAARALSAGATFDATLAIDVRQLRVPVIAFGYWNPIFVRGAARTASRLADAGYAGAIVADLPPDEGAIMYEACRREGLDVPLLVAPTTPHARMAKIVRASTGFVYAVSRLGVTGARSDLDGGVEGHVARIKSETDLPVAVGFGISSAAQVRDVARYADGVVVGSALVDLVARAASVVDACAAVRAACSEMAAACRRLYGHVLG
jgi:tryptophan synthase alpha chain